jgi:hypothetical protein
MCGGSRQKKGDEIVVSVNIFIDQLDYESDLRISHRIRDSKGASKVVHKETLYLNIRTQSILYRMFTANQEIILNLNLTFKVKKILRSVSNYVSNVLDVTCLYALDGAYKLFV